MTFSGSSELLACVTRLSDDTVHDTMSSQGRSYADAQYGNQNTFVDSVSRALSAAVPGGR